MSASSLWIVGCRFRRYGLAVLSVLRKHRVRGVEGVDLGNAGLVRILPKRTSTREVMMADKSFNTERVVIELERTRASIDTEDSKHITIIQECASNGDSPQARAMLETFLSLANAKRIVGKAVVSLKGGESTPAYIVGSWFLYDCYQYLVQREVEALHFVTGVQIDNTFTMDKMVTFDMSHQSVVSARGDINSTHRALMDMERYGHKLHAYFHNHPGRGPAATFPSSVDLDYQARLEKAGYAAIGVIFSRDGHFRAFSQANPFQMNTYGKGVERIDDRLYRLTDVN